MRIIRRKFFVSLRASMYGLAHNTITQGDLDNGLFFFEAGRCYTFGLMATTFGDRVTGKVAKIIGNNQALALEILQQIKAALRRAEQKHTAGWRVRGVGRTGAMVSDLLERNGYPRISESHSPISSREIAETCQLAGVDLSVIFKFKSH